MFTSKPCFKDPALDESESLIPQINLLDPVPLEKPTAAAKLIAPWLKKHFATWEAEIERQREEAPLAINDFPLEYKARIAKLNVKGKL